VRAVLHNHTHDAMGLWVLEMMRGGRGGGCGRRGRGGKLAGGGAVVKKVVVRDRANPHHLVRLWVVCVRARVGVVRKWNLLDYTH
jgi:hypothetical protein